MSKVLSGSIEVPKIFDVLRKELAASQLEPSPPATARISRSDALDSDQHPCAVLAISPLGIRVRTTARVLGSDWLGVASQVQIDQPDSHPIVFRGVVVHVSPARADISLRITGRVVPRLDHVERRRHPRWSCSDEFHPTGVASNPSKFNDFILFRVSDISRSGIRLITSLRNKFLVRGMSLDAIVSFPMVSQVTLELAVENVSFVSDGGKDYLSIGTSLLKTTKNQRAIIGQYVAQFGDLESLSEFRNAGFISLGVSGKLDFGFVRTEQEYREVLNLRHLAYSADGKVAPSSTVNEASDIHDSRARILICRFRGRAVATARVTFHEFGDITEHEEFISWSHEFPRRDESVEVTRVCTHPEFRGRGLLFSLLRYVVITATQAGRTWVVSSSTRDLVPLYRFVGLMEVGVCFNHPDLNNLEHVMLVGSIPDALAGRSVGPTAWNEVWRDAIAFLPSIDADAQNQISRLRIALYRLIGPVLSTIRQTLKSAGR